MKNILIRCDASKSIGLGHVTRCLVLARGFQKRGYNVHFAMKNYSIGIDKIKKEKFPIMPYDKNVPYHDWILKSVDMNNIDIFIGDVRDGLPIKTIRILKNMGILTVAIDEPSEYAKECDICFYPPHANIDKKLYKGEVFQGFEYVILRDEFYGQYDKKKHDIPNILVMMGGTDAYNLTYKIVKQLIGLQDKINIRVIIDKKHSDYYKIKHIDKQVDVYSNVRNMADFLSEIDLGIITFGMSAYELLAMKIPSIHICLNEDHWSASGMFEKLGYAKRYKKDKISISEIELKNFQKPYTKLFNDRTVQTILSFRQKQNNHIKADR